jgi:hypothetical protein
MIFFFFHRKKDTQDYEIAQIKALIFNFSFISEYHYCIFSCSTDALTEIQYFKIYKKIGKWENSDFAKFPSQFVLLLKKRIITKLDLYMQIK